MPGASPRPSGPAASRSWCAPPMPFPPPSNRPRAPSACACPTARRHSGSSAPPAVLWPSPRPTSPGPPIRPASKISIARWWPAPPACTFPMISRCTRSRPASPKQRNRRSWRSCRCSRGLRRTHVVELLAPRRSDVGDSDRPLLAPPPPCSTAPATAPRVLRAGALTLDDLKGCLS